MKSYELTLVVDADLTAEKRKKTEASLKKLIETLKGKVGKTDDWGKKELAYPIKGKNMAYFWFWLVELPPQSPQELDKKLRFQEEVIRYLLVRGQ